MNELIKFLISNDINYNEVKQRFLIFEYKNIRYNFDFELKEFHTVSINNYVDIPFNSFDAIKDNCNNYIEVFMDKNKNYSIIIWFNKEIK